MSHTVVWINIKLYSHFVWWFLHANKFVLSCCIPHTVGFRSVWMCFYWAPQFYYCTHYYPKLYSCLNTVSNYLSDWIHSQCYTTNRNTTLISLKFWTTWISKADLSSGGSKYLWAAPESGEWLFDDYCCCQPGDNLVVDDICDLMTSVIWYLLRCIVTGAGNLYELPQ